MRPQDFDATELLTERLVRKAIEKNARKADWIAAAWRTLALFVACLTALFFHDAVTHQPYLTASSQPIPVHDAVSLAHIVPAQAPPATVEALQTPGVHDIFQDDGRVHTAFIFDGHVDPAYYTEICRRALAEKVDFK